MRAGRLERPWSNPRCPGQWCRGGEGWTEAVDPAAPPEARAGGNLSAPNTVELMILRLPRLRRSSVGVPHREPDTTFGICLQVSSTIFWSCLTPECPFSNHSIRPDFIFLAKWALR